MAAGPDPHPLYRRLRDEAPVLLLPGRERPFFVVSRFEDVRTVLKEDALFSSRANARGVGVIMGHTVIEMDGREHLKHRALVTPVLAPRALRGDFPKKVAGLAHELIDRFIRREQADLCAEFTFLFPLRVLVEIVGLPPDQVEQFHNWAIDLTHVAKDPPRGFEGARQLGACLLPLVQAQRQRPPTPDLISQLCHAEVDGERLSDDEVVSFLRLLVIAGAETTYHLMGNALHVLLHDASLLERVRGDRSQIEALLWETLRWESPIGMLPREATRDTELCGVPIPAGSDLLALIGSANRDERRYRDPDRFDIDRGDRDHLAFGFGKHYCAGSRLAVLEARLGLSALFDRLADLQLAPGQDSRIIGSAFRGPDHLPVRFRALH